MEEESVFNFPCFFPIKVVGKNQDDFESFVVELIKPHLTQTLAEGAVSSRLSSDGNFISITVNITAESRTQLDAIYGDLSKSSRVLMAL